jgi:hypothetical protein
MAGPVELGKDFIEAMKGQPLSLALAVMNVALILLFYFILSVVAEQRKREVQLFYDEARSVREMMAADHGRVMDLIAKCGASRSAFRQGIPSTLLDEAWESARRKGEPK